MSNASDRRFAQVMSVAIVGLIPLVFLREPNLVLALASAFFLAGGALSLAVLLPGHAAALIGAFGFFAAGAALLPLLSLSIGDVVGLEALFAAIDLGLLRIALRRFAVSAKDVRQEPTAR